VTVFIQRTVNIQFRGSIKNANRQGTETFEMSDTMDEQSYFHVYSILCRNTT